MSFEDASVKLQDLNDLLLPFLAGIFTRVYWSKIGIAKRDFNAHEYTELFLEGYGNPAIFQKKPASDAQTDPTGSPATGGKG